LSAFECTTNPCYTVCDLPRRHSLIRWPLDEAVRYRHSRDYIAVSPALSPFCAARDPSAIKFANNTRHGTASRSVVSAAGARYRPRWLHGHPQRQRTDRCHVASNSVFHQLRNRLGAGHDVRNITAWVSVKRVADIIQTTTVVHVVDHLYSREW